jgi:hypothetical protein
VFVLANQRSAEVKAKVEVEEEGSSNGGFGVMNDEL